VDAVWIELVSENFAPICAAGIRGKFLPNALGPTRLCRAFNRFWLTSCPGVQGIRDQFGQGKIDAKQGMVGRLSGLLIAFAP
jgi:hypothetical protein